MEFPVPVMPDKNAIPTVSELTAGIKNCLEKEFPKVWVKGEVSNYKKHTSGHVYFTLKDERSALKAVLFRGEARNIGVDLADGLKIICFGRISVYEVRGDYQLYVEQVVKEEGKGALQLAFEKLRDKLKAEGLFAPEHKKKLPLRPAKIGIVTSTTGAAIKDILRVNKRRYAKLQILIYPARVQGDGAADEIAAGVEYLGRRPDVDVIIIGRGGGSAEDLWAFNEEKLARAIFACPKPVVSAVGHETDFTIADFVADLRAPTPSAAAEMVVEKEEAFRERIGSLALRLSGLIRYCLQERQVVLSDLAGRGIFQDFRIRLMNLGQAVDDLENRARQAMEGRRRRILETKAAAALAEQRLINLMGSFLREKVSAWDRLTTALNGLSPLNILKKGYTLCWKNGGLRVVHSVDEINQGDSVMVTFYRGGFEARVGAVDREKPAESRFVKE